MKKTYYLIAATLMAVLGATTGCSSDSETAKQALAQPTVSVDAAQTAANRLTFKWAKVDNATEYSYVLTDADGGYIGGGLGSGITYSNKTLLPGKEYILSVTAYPLSGSESLQSSETVTLKAKTDALDIKPSISGAKMSLAWSNLIDADSIIYKVAYLQGAGVPEVSGCQSEDNNVEYTASYIGDYKVSLTSYYTEGVEYAISGCSHVFSFRNVTGKAYLDGIGKSIAATLTMNDDGTFTISNWYGGTKDITFSINDDGTIEVVNAESVTPDGKFYNVLTGRSNNAGDVYNVAINKAKSIAYDAKGNKSGTLSYAHGKISFYVILSDCNEDDVDNTSDDCMYTFTW